MSAVCCEEHEVICKSQMCDQKGSQWEANQSILPVLHEKIEHPRESVWHQYKEIERQEISLLNTSQWLKEACGTSIYEDR